jgi:hypothetical protein
VVNPDSSEWLIDTDSLDFSPGNGTTPQTFTITGVDDDEVDGDIAGVIVLSPVVSDDPRYQGIDPPDINAINRDDESIVAPAWQIEATDLEVSEAGDTGLIRIAFDRLPSADVHVEVSSADTSEVVADPVDLVFTVANAMTAQTVVLRGLDDDIADGPRDVPLTVRVTSSADSSFADLPAQNLVARNLDDDVANIGLALTGPEHLLEGESTALQIAFGSRPLAPVEISLEAMLEPPAGADDAEFVLLPDTVTIEPAQWDQPVLLNLNTFDNGVVNERRVIGIHVLAITTTDPVYAGLAVDPLQVTLDDGDAGSVVVEPIPGPGPLALISLGIGVMLLGSIASLPRQKRRA